MDGKSHCRWYLAVIALVTLPGVALAEERIWSDKTGKFSVAAEFQEVQGDNVVLRRSNGKEISVPLARLSKADQAFVRTLREADSARNKDTDDKQAADQIIAEIAESFYGDLRSQERDVARQSLTQKAEALMKAGQSPLAGLPQPEAGSRTIRLGRVALDGDVAEIAVLVRAGGAMHKTKLHLRYEDDQWKVFALSATYPDGEKSINFEAVAAPQQDVDPLQAIVGKALELEGYTIDGAPLTISDYKGKIVLVDFWATWCGPCRAEIPNIAENWQKHHEDGFEVIAVSVDEDLSALKSFVAAEQPPWAVVADNHPRNKKSMAAMYGIRGIPAFILVGRDGKVAAVHCRGPRLGQALGQLIRGGDKVSNIDGPSNPRPSLAEIALAAPK